MTKISALGIDPNLTGTEEVMLLQGGATTKTPFSALATLLQSDRRWRLVPAASYTNTTAVTSVLTMADTSPMKVGLPIKWTQAGTVYYAIVVTVTANVSITIRGAPFQTGGVVVSNLYVGAPELVQTREFYVPGAFGVAVQDILASVGGQYARWDLGAARLVTFAAVEKTADTGTEPKINVKSNGNLVSTEDGNLGLQPVAAGTWVYNSNVAIETTNYIVSRGHALDIRCTAAGGAGNAADLSLVMTFVLE